MTQQALADHIGVTRQTVNAIELGKYSPSLARLGGVGGDNREADGTPEETSDFSDDRQ